jgi:hypothetical protein
VNTWRSASLPTRRLTSRVETPEGVWVYWQCHGREDVSSVRDMSLGGMFLKTPKSKPVGAPVKLHFLVQEGQIRADAVVRHVESGTGLGLKFMALSDEDRPRLAALMARLRGTPGSRR